MSQPPDYQTPLDSLVVPAPLQSKSGWLGWRFEQIEGESKPRKVPYYASGKRRKGRQGSAEDRASLATFPTARDAAIRFGYDGLGFAPLPGFGIVALDFDNCVVPGKPLPPEIQKISQQSYAEYSPSGKGIRVLFRGDIGNYKSHEFKDKVRVHPYGFETFSTNGFVTITGNILPHVELLGMEDTIEFVTQEVTDLCHARFGHDTRTHDVDDENDPLATFKPKLNLSLQEMKTALRFLDPDMPRDEWLRVGMALHHETDGDDTGFALWNDWSAGGGKYPDEERLRKDWDSFDRPRSLLRTVTMATVLRMVKEARNAHYASDGEGLFASGEADGHDPVDLWRQPEPPPLPEGLLPEVIERFARVQAEVMGADPAGLAMAALTVCAAAIPDSVKLQVKRYDRNWTEPARIWTALVGPPSAKKSPIISAAGKPLRKLNSRLIKEYKNDLAAHERLSAVEKAAQPAPVLRQLVLEDTTIEGAQLVLAENHEGVLCIQDELSGFFGSMEKYNGPRAAATNRAFYLQAFNGGPFIINRVGRGASEIPNLSISLLGGIQPELIRKTMQEAQDDGLIQRLFSIVLRPSCVGRDEPTPDVVHDYEALVAALRDVKLFMFDSKVLQFDSGAQQIWKQAEENHHRLQQTEVVNPKLATHIGKYDGLLARLCVIWHCIENVGADHLPAVIAKCTVQRVVKFLDEFLFGHALAFYGSVLGISEDHDQLRDVAGYILTHRKTTMTFRDLQRGSRGMKALSRDQAKKLFERLEAFGWVGLEEPLSLTVTPRWLVNPAVHRLYEDRAREEATRRQQVRQVIAGIVDTKGG